MGLNFSSEEKVATGKKRRNAENVEDVIPFKKRITTTYEHVYQELFKNGKSSDIAVHALGETWKLHRIYITQCPYFRAMLNGDWKEKDTNSIELNISDPFITTDSLDILFGSFYSDSIQITVKNVVNVCAAASWFNVEDIRSICESLMINDIRSVTLCDFYNAADRYDMAQLKSSCVRWLSRSIVLLENNEESFNLLKEVSIDLMQKVIENPTTIVLSMEQDLFLTLMKWMYLKNNDHLTFNPKDDLLDRAFHYFSNEKPNFLLSMEGQEYVQIFKSIRLENIINTHKSATRMMREEIFPMPWVIKAFCTQWLRVLHCHEKVQNQISTNSSNSRSQNVPGTSSTSVYNQDLPFIDALGEEDFRRSDPLRDILFWRLSERCGRIIEKEESVISWKWDCYHFGCDIIIKYKRRAFSMIKFTNSRPSPNTFPSDMKISMRVISKDALTEEKFNAADHLPDSMNYSFPFNNYRAVSTHGNQPVSDDCDQDSADESSDHFRLSDQINHSNFAKDLSLPPEQSKYFFASTQPYVKKINLDEHNIHEILRLPENFHFPVVISANILRYDPVEIDPRTFERL